MKFLFLFAVMASSMATVNAQDLILGKWMNSDNTEIIEITKKKDTYVGHIFWLKQPTDKNGNPKLDGKNPDKKLRQQVLLGSQNIFGLLYRNQQWKEGKIYSHKKGGTVNFNIADLTKSELIIKISMGFLSKKIAFTRVK